MSCEETGVCEPAASLIKRLGGPREVARGIRVYSITGDGDRRARSLNHSTVFRWTVPTSRGGTGGVIPVKYWPAIIKLGREHDQAVSIDDLSPRVAQALKQVTGQHSAGQVA